MEEQLGEYFVMQSARKTSLLNKKPSASQPSLADFPSSQAQDWQHGEVTWVSAYSTPITWPT
jgi:hypothetical protein